MKTWLIIILIALAGLTLGAVDADKANPIHSPQRLLWQTDLQGTVRSSALALGDRLYCGSDAGCFFSIDRTDGRIVWSFAADSAVCSTPAAAGDLVLFASRKGTIYALRRDSGKPAWSMPTTTEMRYAGGWDYFVSSPAVTGDVVYVGSGDHHLRALHARTGRPLWKHDCGAVVRATPTLWQGTVYAATMNGEIIALDAATGTRKWVFKAAGNQYFPKGEFLFAPVVHQGLLFAGSRDASFYALDASSGTLKWKVTDKNRAWYTTAIAAEGTVYACSSDGHYIQALEAVSGTKKWEFMAEDLIFTTPALVDGVLYFGSHDGHLYAVTAADGRRLWKHRVGAAVLSSPLSGDGVVWFGADDGRFYALQGRTRPTADGKNVVRAVYWSPQSDELAKLPPPLQPRFSRRVYEMFRDQGYVTVDAATIGQFLQARQNDGKPTVLVLASFILPFDVVERRKDRPSVLRGFLEAGNTLLLPGTPAFLYVYAAKPGAKGAEAAPAMEEWRDLLRLDPESMRQAFNFYDNYTTRATPAGREYGFPAFWSMAGGIKATTSDTVLMTDELGRASAWIRNCGGPTGSGVIRAWGGENLPEPAYFLLELAERSLDRPGK